MAINNKFWQERIFQSYLNDISIYPLLTAKREKELATIIQNSNDENEKQKAKNELILSNLKLVVKCAIDTYNRFHEMPEMNLSIMDLIQTGNINLIHCVDCFKVDKNVKFSSYAYLSLVRCMMKAIYASRFIRVPHNYFHYFREIESLKEKGYCINPDEILKKIKISKNLLPILLNNKSSKISLDALNLYDKNGIYEDFIEDKSVNIEQEIQNKDLYSYIIEKLKKINPFYQYIIIEKFFSGTERTLGSISHKCNCSRENIRLHLIKALQALKTEIENDKNSARIYKIKENIKTPKTIQKKINKGFFKNKNKSK